MWKSICYDFMVKPLIRFLKNRQGGRLRPAFKVCLLKIDPSWIEKTMKNFMKLLTVMTIHRNLFLTLTWLVRNLCNFLSNRPFENIVSVRLFQHISFRVKNILDKWNVEDCQVKIFQFIKNYDVISKYKKRLKAFLRYRIDTDTSR